MTDQPHQLTNIVDTRLLTDGKDWAVTVEFDSEADARKYFDECPSRRRQREAERAAEVKPKYDPLKTYDSVFDVDMLSLHEFIRDADANTPPDQLVAALQLHKGGFLPLDWAKQLQADLAVRIKPMPPAVDATLRQIVDDAIASEERWANRKPPAPVLLPMDDVLDADVMTSWLTTMTEHGPDCWSVVVDFHYEAGAKKFHDAMAAGVPDVKLDLNGEPKKFYELKQP
jgi:hypothetical protein